MIAWLVTLLLTLPQGELERAERAYRLGQFEVALQLYEQALPRAGDRRGAVLYDLGNCAYRLDRFAVASLHYRRALRLLPDGTAALHNLQLAERRLGVDGGGQGAVAASARGWPWLAAAFALQLAGLVGIGRRRDDVARARRAVAGAALLGGIVAAGAVAFAQWSPAPTQAVVLQPAVLRAEANDGAAAVAALRPGECATLVARAGEWLRLERGGTAGWVAAAAVGTVE